MRSQRRVIPRILPRQAQRGAAKDLQPARHDAPRLVRRTLVDFSSLRLPEDVRLALAEAFWSHVGVRAARGIKAHWTSMLTLNRFATESGAITSLSDLDRQMLLRYIEWLNTQRRTDDGRPWAISTRACVYSSLHQLLKWLERCRPELVGSIDYPFCPFPGRGTDRPPRQTVSARQLRAILRACEADIAQTRANRDAAAAARASDSRTVGSLGWLIEQIEVRYGGIFPSALEFKRAGNHPLQKALHRFGGAKQVEPYLYPRAVSLLPYYLAILIHAAGNPEPIVELERNCLQSIPLLDDRQALMWFKGRARSFQRRSFERTDPLGPPALVADILSWNERLLPLAPAEQRNRLLIFKGMRTVNAMSTITVHHLLEAFCNRHGLPRFSLASVRPSVLSIFYRVSGDLLRTKVLANHANLATTVRYVETPLVQAHNRSRIATLQGALLEQIEATRTDAEPAAATEPTVSIPAGRVVSMFGFDCKDPMAGIAPGTRRGEMCTNFMGCFTCPNAIIASDPATLARLLQARDHLREAATMLHPARWEAFYAPQLRILEEDILSRYTAQELAAGELHRARLPPLPELR